MHFAWQAQRAAGIPISAVTPLIALEPVAVVIVVVVVCVTRVEVEPMVVVVLVVVETTGQIQGPSFGPVNPLVHLRTVLFPALNAARQCSCRSWLL